MVPRRTIFDNFKRPNLYQFLCRYIYSSISTRFLHGETIDGIGFLSVLLEIDAFIKDLELDSEFAGKNRKKSVDLTK